MNGRTTTRQKADSAVVAAYERAAPGMSARRFDIIRPDTLLFVLGGFAEPEPTARDRWLETVRCLRLAGVTNREIGDRLGVTAEDISHYAMKLGLPKRPNRWSSP
jgi:hypothetical protein